ncbi:hypothetical protein GWC95_12000 [Sediminibacterium roseum]|uniref:Uncharacterized protein n=1 Tax=Sediminibacterium roseum TaxID=1978412 RepID=A0ABW9ZU31_9BACT|nr:hypothetical protein [Sediminibacterium roseum]NCI50651.1 hypothetical protein [Sediminibacterium roseum]
MNTENPNCFVYEAGELKIELLGGVRIDTLDRMRVTMKVTVVNRKHKQYMDNEELAGLSVRHNLDLYNDMQNPAAQTTLFRSKVTIYFAGELLLEPNV